MIRGGRRPFDVKPQKLALLSKPTPGDTAIVNTLFVGFVLRLPPFCLHSVIVFIPYSLS